MHFRYASDDDILPDSAKAFSSSDADILVAEEEGEVLGSAVYGEKNNIGVLKHVEVYGNRRGERIGSGLVDRALEEMNTDALFAYATAMDGKVQTMLQNRGFEVSGLEADNRLSELHPNASGGFNLNLWRLDEEIQAYLPEELRDFADTSLREQREVSYLEPDTDALTGSFDIVRSKLMAKNSERGSKRTNRLHIDIEEVSTLKKHIQGAIDVIDADEDYWAKTVSLDTTQPLTHELARNLHQRGFKPVDLSPSIDGQELTMIDLDVEAGIYSVTDETLELIDSTGLNYEVQGANDRTTQIVFQPETRE